MALDSKYGRVELEHGTIGADEPVFVLRAQDKMVPALLAFYLVLCTEAGSPKHHLDSIFANVARFEEWQRENFTKVPESA